MVVRNYLKTGSTQSPVRLSSFVIIFNKTESDTSNDIADNEAIFSILAASAQILYNSDSVSDTETEDEWGDFKKGRAPNILCDFEGAYTMLRRNYFIGEQNYISLSWFVAPWLKTSLYPQARYT